MVTTGIEQYGRFRVGTVRVAQRVCRQPGRTIGFCDEVTDGIV